MKENEIYILNPEYNFKSDHKRAVLYTSSTDPIIAETVSGIMVG